MSQSQQHKQGYTLIEVLVVMVITGLILTFGLSSFQTFTQRQVVKSSANQLLADLEYAKSQAGTGRKPAGCTNLDGYSIAVLSGSNKYNISAECVNSAGLPELCSGTDCLKQTTLDPDIKLSMTAGYSKIVFYTLNRGTNITPQPSMKILIQHNENIDLNSNLTILRSGAIEHASGL